MAEFHVIWQTQIHIPASSENEPILYETYASEADFVKELIAYYEHLIDELSSGTNYFEDEGGIDALSEIREHIANLTKHISTNEAKPLKPEDYGFKGLWWYWVNVYVATYKIEVYEKYIRDNLSNDYDV